MAFAFTPPLAMEMNRVRGIETINWMTIGASLLRGEITVVC